jgi:nickel transport protein
MGDVSLRGDRPRRRVAALWLAAAIALPVGEAAAHSIRVLASGEGRRIAGYAYFSKTARARDSVVVLRGPDGVEIARARTNDIGEFAFDVTARADYQVAVDTGDGHQASYRVEAIELDASLPPYDSSSSSSSLSLSSSSSSSSSFSAPSPSSSSPSSSTALSSAEAHRMLAEMLARQREQLDDFESRTRLRDILGGVGYILGLTGLAFFFLGARRRERPKP